MNSTEHMRILPEHERLVSGIDLATALEQERRWRLAISPADVTLLQICALRLAIEIESLRGQAGVLRKLLAQADGVLGTLVPDSADEDELLGLLRAGIGGAMAGSGA